MTKLAHGCGVFHNVVVVAGIVLLPPLFFASNCAIPLAAPVPSLNPFGPYEVSEIFWTCVLTLPVSIALSASLLMYTQPEERIRVYFHPMALFAFILFYIVVVIAPKAKGVYPVPFLGTASAGAMWVFFCLAVGRKFLRIKLGEVVPLADIGAPKAGVLGEERPAPENQEAHVLRGRITCSRVESPVRNAADGTIALQDEETAEKVETTAAQERLYSEWDYGPTGPTMSERLGCLRHNPEEDTAVMCRCIRMNREKWLLFVFLQMNQVYAVTYFLCCITLVALSLTTGLLQLAFQVLFSVVPLVMAGEIDSLWTRAGPMRNLEWRPLAGFFPECCCRLFQSFMIPKIAAGSGYTFYLVLCLKGAQYLAPGLFLLDKKYLPKFLFKLPQKLRPDFTPEGQRRRVATLVVAKLADLCSDISFIVMYAYYTFGNNAAFYPFNNQNRLEGWISVTQLTSILMGVEVVFSLPVLLLMRYKHRDALRQIWSTVMRQRYAVLLGCYNLLAIRIADVFLIRHIPSYYLLTFGHNYAS